MTQMFENDPFGAMKRDKADLAPSAREVNKFHEKDDVDVSASAHHHSLGTSKDQAASGSHNHSQSKVGNGLGLTVSGSKGGNAALTSLLAALSQVIEFTDTTT